MNRYRYNVKTNYALQVYPLRRDLLRTIQPARVSMLEELVAAFFFALVIVEFLFVFLSQP